MPRVSLSAMASGLLAAAVSAQTEQQNLRVYAAVAYVHHGEKTPTFSTLDESLTPEGAQQMYRQGRAFRARYLNDTDGLTEDELEALGSASIHGLSTDALVASQVNAMSTADDWVSASALSFFQGLYPPSTNSYSTASGGEDLGRNFAVNGSEVVDFPLDGYQYPRLQTLSTLDMDSPSIQGTTGCTAWTNEMNVPLRQTDSMEALYADNEDLYQDVFTSGPLAGAVTQETANFWNAQPLYEYVQYMYAHNETVFNELEDANHTISRLEDNALALERAKNTDPGSGTSDTLRELYPIAGKTLAMTIADSFQRNLDWYSRRDKLVVMFGSFEPLLAYLSVAGILNRANTESGAFAHFPQHGATMVLELVGDEPEDGYSSPNPADLLVRFYYRANTNTGEPFESFSLFGSGLGGSTVPYLSFYRQMTDAGATSERWCDICGSTTAPWCSNFASDSPAGTGSGGSSDSSSRSGNHLHPALGGLIGAVIMAVVIGIVGVALFLFGGYRIRRGTSDDRDSSVANGGFKGPEKKDADADVAVSPIGQPQERVGSWEMRDGAVINRGAETDNEDSASVFGATVVKPREGV